MNALLRDVLPNGPSDRKPKRQLASEVVDMNAGFGPISRDTTLDLEAFNWKSIL